MSEYLIVARRLKPGGVHPHRRHGPDVPPVRGGGLVRGPEIVQFDQLKSILFELAGEVGESFLSLDIQAGLSRELPRAIDCSDSIVHRFDGTLKEHSTVVKTS